MIVVFVTSDGSFLSYPIVHIWHINYTYCYLYLQLTKLKHTANPFRELSDVSKYILRPSKIRIEKTIYM